MSSNNLHCRSWGVNHGEEEFLGPVGMVTFAWCSAECPHCYLAEVPSPPVPVPLPEFPALVESLLNRGAQCLYLLNPEKQIALLSTALDMVRSRFPDLPQVLKLGGHEAPEEVLPLLERVDACSLDVKAFEPDQAADLGETAHPKRSARLAALAEEKLGSFRLTEQGVRGWWVRHVGLPGRIDHLGEQVRRFFPTANVPIWFSREYRPFGRARELASLNRKLSFEERQSLENLVQNLNSEGWPAWLR